MRTRENPCAKYQGCQARASCEGSPRLRLWGDLNDASSPVAEGGAGLPTTAEGRGGLVLRQGTGLADVLLSEPYGIAIDCGRSIVSPARVVTLDFVSGEAILSAYSGSGNLNIADARDGVETGESDAWIVLGPGRCEGEHASTALSDCHGAVGYVEVGNGEVTLVDDCGTR